MNLRYVRKKLNGYKMIYDANIVLSRFYSE